MQLLWVLKNKKSLNTKVITYAKRNPINIECLPEIDNWLEIFVNFYTAFIFKTLEFANNPSKRY